MEQIKKLAAEVFSTLGAGFSERIYHNAMEIQFRKNNIEYETERNINVEFKGLFCGAVRVDLIVNKSIVVELKQCKKINEEHETQCEMYMNLLGLKQGLVICFPNSNKDPLTFTELDFQEESIDSETEENYDKNLYEELRKERNAIASEKGVSAFCVIYNNVLKEIALHKPTTKEELMKIKGIKDKKYQQYGEILLQVVKGYLKTDL